MTFALKIQSASIVDFNLGVDADGSDENLAAALHHVGPRQHHRVDRHTLVHLNTSSVGLGLG